METMVKIDELFTALESKDNTVRFEAFTKLLEITDKGVSWVYDYWQDLVDKLNSSNSFHRSIGLILLAYLSKSDSEDKFGDILDRYLTFFEDEKFITSRQCLQNVWRIAVNKPAYKERIVESLKNAFCNNIHLNRNEKLIKQDVVFSLNQISNFYEDKILEEEILKLIALEKDKKIGKSLSAAKN